MGRSWRESGWIENVWSDSSQSPFAYIDPFGSAWANNCLPPMSVSHQAVVFTLPSLRREAGLKKLVALNG
jgi:hypothetical protein